jgi:hypothetical protein
MRLYNFICEGFLMKCHNCIVFSYLKNPGYMSYTIKLRICATIDQEHLFCFTK